VAAAEATNHIAAAVAKEGAGAAAPTAAAAEAKTRVAAAAAREGAEAVPLLRLPLKQRLVSRAFSRPLLLKRELEQLLPTAAALLLLKRRLKQLPILRLLLLKVGAGAAPPNCGCG
jgi:hypothetical protein